MKRIYDVLDSKSKISSFERVCLWSLIKVQFWFHFRFSYNKLCRLSGSRQALTCTCFHISLWVHSFFTFLMCNSINSDQQQNKYNPIYSRKIVFGLEYTFHLFLKHSTLWIQRYHKSTHIQLLYIHQLADDVNHDI